MSDGDQLRVAGIIQCPCGGTKFALTTSMVRGRRALVVAVTTLSILAVAGVRPSAQRSSVPHRAEPTGVAASQRRDSTDAVTSRFRSRVDLIPLDVCVRARDGQLIDDLASQDFLILENNVPQRLSLFLPEGRVPLAVVLLIDRSHSMAGLKLEYAKAAASQFLRVLGPDDLVEVIAFNERADRPIQLGPHTSAAEEAIARLTGEGQTGLFEALAVAQRDLDRLQGDHQTDYRKAIVVLSDGEDTISVLTFEDVQEQLRRSGTLVYALSLPTDEKGRWIAPPRELAQLAYDTGGRATAVTDLTKLTPVYQEIGAELRHLYRLAYVSSNGARDGKWRTISVRLLNRDARARTRAGYYAPRPPSKFWKGSDKDR